jgi:hypothetical protein
MDESLIMISANEREDATKQANCPNICWLVAVECGVHQPG